MPDPAAPIASLWLLAAETDERDFVAEIERLAARHGTPVFHPHLTLLGIFRPTPWPLKRRSAPLPLPRQPLLRQWRMS